MPAPALTVTLGARGIVSPDPDDVGADFDVNLFDRGPVGVATECFSLEEVIANFGDVQTYSYGIRNAERYFREGGTRWVGSRAVGPTPVKATLAVSSAAPAVVGTVTAISPGTWGNDLTITVTTTTGSNRTVVLEDDGVVVSTGTYATAADWIAAFEATGLVTVTPGVGVWPLANLAETALATGTDDHGAITLTQWGTAIDVFGADDELGPGFITAAGITTPGVHELLLRHAKDHNRFAICDPVDTATIASLTGPAATLRALDDTIPDGETIAGRGIMPWPWLIVDEGSTTVTIPPSGAVAGRCALADRENTMGPGQWAGNRFGILATVTDLTQTASKADRDTLSDAGVMVIRRTQDSIRIMDSLTLADAEYRVVNGVSVVTSPYASANGMRVVMAVWSQGAAALLTRLLETIDGKGHLAAAARIDLNGICADWYIVGALYGETPEEAFAANVAVPAPGALAATIELRTSEPARTITLRITKVAAGDVL